jgi:hypothetical protein
VIRFLARWRWTITTAIIASAALALAITGWTLAWYLLAMMAGSAWLAWDRR